MLHIPFCWVCELKGSAAKSSSGWITPLWNTLFFCHKFNTLMILLLSSIGHLNRWWNVMAMFLQNLGPKTSFSTPNWCLDCRTIESITYKPGTLYSGRHCNKHFVQYTINKWLSTLKLFRKRQGYLLSAQTFLQTVRHVCRTWWPWLQSLWCWPS